jgi:fucose permease
MTTLAPTRSSGVTGGSLALTAFILCALFHFCQYAARSAPGVMVSELSTSLGMTTAAVGSLIGSYYYTYSLMSVVAGGALDRFGVRGPVGGGMLMLAVVACCSEPASTVSLPRAGGCKARVPHLRSQALFM